jgi:hypothetical protein
VEVFPDRRAAAYVVGVVVRYGLFSALFRQGTMRDLVPPGAPTLDAWASLGD